MIAVWECYVRVEVVRYWFDLPRMPHENAAWEKEFRPHVTNKLVMGTACAGDGLGRACGSQSTKLIRWCLHATRKLIKVCELQVIYWTSVRLKQTECRARLFLLISTSNSQRSHPRLQMLLQKGCVDPTAGSVNAVAIAFHTAVCE